ncbi:MAG TPA: CHASE2 domain-containing protein [Thermoanaerobaculia bacterium]|nr:CHASE2 domain-containing protein [Thermoanaerobaculia bacterium]
MGIFAKTWNKTGLREKGIAHWLLAIFLVLVGFHLSYWLSRYDWWQDACYSASNALVSLTPATTTHPSHTAVVLIDDDDYWRGEWARRVPLKRHTLARLLRTIKAASPRGIAVDIDLRCQTPDGSVIVHDDYREETEDLLTSVRDIGRNIPIVLGKSIGFDETRRKFVVDADVFDRFDFGDANVHAGYTRLPRDLRQVALSAATTGINLDSFASVASRLDRQSLKTATNRSGTSLPFVRSFFGRDQFESASALVPARKILTGDSPAMHALRGKFIIVGGDWHRDAYGRGERIDAHMTPQGWMSGALIHANYIEAVLSEQVMMPSGEGVHLGVELAIGFLLTSIFACAISYWKILYLIALACAVALFSLLAWANLGVFVDAAPPLILLAGNAATEKVLDWKRAADQHRACATKTESA